MSATVRSIPQGRGRLESITLLLLMGVVLASCKPSRPTSTQVPAKSTPAANPLRAAAYYWPGQYWVDIAHHKGWFKEEGLNVQRVDTNTNYFGSFDDLVLGRLDAVEFTFFDLVAYAAKGHDLVGVLLTDYSSGAEALVARSEFSRISDLKGRRIALSRGTYLEYLLAVFAKQAGLTLNDFVVVDVPGEVAHEELIAGRADAVLTWEPLCTVGLEAVKGRKLTDSSLALGTNGGLLVFRRQFVREREGEVRGFVRTWHRATQFIQEHPAEAWRVVAQVQDKQSSEVEAFAHTDRILNVAENLRAVSFTSGVDSIHGTLRRINDFMIERGLTTNQVDTARLIDPRFLEELR